MAICAGVFQIYSSAFSLDVVVNPFKCITTSSTDGRYVHTAVSKFFSSCHFLMLDLVGLTVVSVNCYTMNVSFSCTCVN